MTRYERLPTSRPSSECGSDNEEHEEKEYTTSATSSANNLRGCNVNDANDDGGDADREIEPDDPTSSEEKTSEKAALPTPKTHLEKALFLTGIFLPWSASAFVSHLPFIWLEFTEAPLPLTLNAVASALEVSLILAICIYIYHFKRRNEARLQAGEPKLNHPWLRKIFIFCLNFLLFDPIVMGIYLLSSLFTTCAEGDNKHVQCGISTALFNTIMWFRLVGVSQILILFMNLFKSVVKNRQDKEESAAGEA